MFKDLSIISDPVEKWNDVKVNNENVSNDEQIVINNIEEEKLSKEYDANPAKQIVFNFMVYIQRFIAGIYYILSVIRSIPVFGNILVGILLTSLYQKCFIFQIVCDLLIGGALTILDITGLTDVFYDVCYKILTLFGGVASTYLPGIMNNVMESYFATRIAQVISEQVSTQVSAEVTAEVTAQVTNQIAIQSFQISQELIKQGNYIQLLIEHVKENGNVQTSLTQIINNAIASSATSVITNSATSLIGNIVNNAIKNIPKIANGGKIRRKTRRKNHRNKKAKTKKRKVNKKTTKKKMKAKKKTKMNRKKSKRRRNKK